MPTITIPDTSEGLQELLGDHKKVAEIFGESGVKNGLAREFMDKYSAAAGSRNPDTDGDLRTQVQSVMFDMLRENGAARADTGKMVSFHGGKPSLNLTADGSAALAKGRGALYNKGSFGHKMSEAVPKNEQLSTIGEYLAAIRADRIGANSATQMALVDKLNAVRRFQDSFSSEDPGSGGFLIPELMRSELLQLALENSIVRSRATVIPMTTLRVPIPALDETSHATSLFGGVIFYWTEEAAALTESNATFGRIVLDAKKLTGFFKVPNELLADAPAFSGWFDSRIPAGLAWFEDVAFLNETGAGTPMGVLQSPAYIQVDRKTNSQINYADIVTMYSRMLPQSLSDAVWIANIDTFPQLAQLTQSSSNPGIWLGGWAARDASDAPPVTIMGRPVLFTEKVPPMGTLGDISFVDLSYYLIGDRQSIAVAASDQFAFQNDQTAYRIIERVDGRPWVQSALTPHSGSANTLSPYVGLSTVHT